MFSGCFILCSDYPSLRFAYTCCLPASDRKMKVVILTGMTGGSSVARATAVAAKRIPCLGAPPTMLTVVRNTSAITGKKQVRCVKQFL